MIGCIEIESARSAGSSDADEVLEHVTVVVSPDGDTVDNAVAFIVVRLIQRDRK